MTADPMIDFLSARLDEAAEAAERTHDQDCWALDLYRPMTCECGVPERLAADVEAKRRLVSEWTTAVGRRDEEGRPVHWHDPAQRMLVTWLYDVLRVLAAVYSDHRGYWPEWRAPGPARSLEDQVRMAALLSATPTASTPDVAAVSAEPIKVTSSHVDAARARVQADRTLGNETPSWVERVAALSPQHPRG